MFVACAVAVVSFMKQKVNASLEINNITNTGTLSTGLINGKCSYINGKTVTNKPTGVLCAAGNQMTTVETAIGWEWKCQGINNGTSAYCKVVRYVQTPTNITITPQTSNLEVVRDISDDVDKVITETVKTTTETVNNVTTQAPKITENQTPKTAAASTNYNVTAMIAPIVENDTVVIEDEQQRIDAQKEAQRLEQEKLLEDATQGTGGVEQSQIITAPVVVEAKNLAKENNPKLAGVVVATLKVESVSLNEKYDGNSRVALAGKSEPGALVTVFIFSNDPTVITIKADDNGNWSYELDKELADGQHEAYVAVTDESGKIISKSEPIAFVKTAQAANMIPTSQFSANQSPIERSTQQYVLIAIVIMSVFLVIALVLIGFLTHKRNLDEGIY